MNSKLLSDAPFFRGVTRGKRAKQNDTDHINTPKVSWPAFIPLNVRSAATFSFDTASLNACICILIHSKLNPCKLYT